jgi:hypothetical protein
VTGLLHLGVSGGAKSSRPILLVEQTKPAPIFGSIRTGIINPPKYNEASFNVQEVFNLGISERLHWPSCLKTWITSRNLDRSTFPSYFLNFYDLTHSIRAGLWRSAAICG